LILVLAPAGTTEERAVVGGEPISDLVDGERKYRNENMRIAAGFERSFTKRDTGKVIEVIRIGDHFKVLDRLCDTENILPHDLGGPVLSRSHERNIAHEG